MKNGVGKDGKEKGKCKACGKEYTCPSKSRTSHLSRHIPKCHMIPQFYNVEEMLIDCERKLRKRIFDPKKNWQILSRKYHKFFNEDCQSIYR